MKFKFVGREMVDYVSRKTNEQVAGVKLHVIGVKDANNRVEGSAVEALWISKRSAMYDEALQLPIDSDIDCGFNRWGNLDSFKVLK